MPRKLPLGDLRTPSVPAKLGVDRWTCPKAYSEALYPAKAGITARVNVVQRQGKITYKSVNGSCSRSHFLRVCKKRPYDIKKETYNSPDEGGGYAILLKRVKSWVLGCSSKVDKRFPCANARRKANEAGSANRTFKNSISSGVRERRITRN